MNRPAVAIRIRRAAARLLGTVLLLAVPSFALSGATVRVLLEEAVASAEIDVAGGHTVRTSRGSARTALPLSWPLVSEGEEIHSGASRLGTWIELLPDDGVIRYGGRSYRGGLRIESAPAGLRVINVVDLEGYLRGVVPAEMQASWPMEALKAQAVAARSYVLASLDPAAPWDICASDSCQVYGGLDAEHPRSDLAVAATEGVVISHAGAPAAAYYHADSGGVVAGSAEVWGRQIPYLQSRTDIDSASPHRGWTVTLRPEVLASALAGEGVSLGTPTSLTVLAHSGSGRASRAEIVGTAGRTVLQGPRLTRVLREAGLKSTRIVSLGPLSVRGDGWGHGVGMSQYGARSLAASGHDYGSILAFYYPGIGLQRRIYRASN